MLDQRRRITKIQEDYNIFTKPENQSADLQPTT